MRALSLLCLLACISPPLLAADLDGRYQGTLELIDARHPLLEENLRQLAAISERSSTQKRRGVEESEAETRPVGSVFELSGTSR